MANRFALVSLLLPLFLGAADAWAGIDCAQCRAVCKEGAKPYHDDLGADSVEASHKSQDAQAAFSDARRKDPAFGGADVAGAVEAYKRAVILDNDNAQYRNYLAAALLWAGRIDEAIYNLEQAHSLVPSEPKFVVNLGYAYHRAGDETRAMLYYTRALMLDPRNLRGRLFLGYALELMGYRVEAVTELKKVLVQDPANEGAKHALRRLGVVVVPIPTGGTPPAPGPR
ncbi:MAG: tetratricopeptide repeat protein [Deltaproteobacteria bacterium]|nr:tetratricopeptide repeat protein [Deltaproteobacteria bacterium]